VATTSIEELARGVPKTELHLHIEGTLEPELMFAIAKRNEVDLRFRTVDEVRAAYRFGNLQDFLDIYYEGAKVLLKEADFHDLTWAYLERAAKANVRHAEIFFDPQTHTDRGVPFETVVKGIRAALDEGTRRLGITSGLILCFLRHLPASAAMATLEQALPFREHLLGVGLDSSEKGHPPEEFEAVYARARKEGLRAVAHAGEEGPPEYVWQALDRLGVERIDHGNRALEDPRLVERLAKQQTPLTMCPLSNVKLRVVDRIERHPLATILGLGLRASVNSDDPAYFGGYVDDNLVAVSKALGLSREQVRTLARNGVESSFIDAARRAALLAEIDRFFA
jgi:adenine deaminase